MRKAKGRKENKGPPLLHSRKRESRVTSPRTEAWAHVHDDGEPVGGNTPCNRQAGYAIRAGGSGSVGFLCEYLAVLRHFKPVFSAVLPDKKS
jgi:hypothetical protein